MSPPNSLLDIPPQNHQKINPTLFLSNKNINNLYKLLISMGLFLFLFYTLLSNHTINQSSQPSIKLIQPLNDTISHDPTNISHIVIGIASTSNFWKNRRPYIESWWVPNVTKGYVYLDRAPTNVLPWPSTSPPYRVSKSATDNSNKHKVVTRRIVRVIVEAFKEAHEGIRWFVMVDDDTILFLDNLVETLKKYDHKKYFYIGENSESVLSNFDTSFEMAFGGGGYAISYPLAEALSKNLDVCIERYPYIFHSDHLMHHCVADLGVSLTHEKGFHQIDLHGDLTGFLSSHPQAPILSLHHVDMVDPLFPSMNRSESLNHLMKAAKENQPKLLQQTICYDNTKNWSFSIAWGYTVEIYEHIIPVSVLEKPLETFIAWRKPSRMSFMFNTRPLSRNPCDMPHVFYLQSVERIDGENQIVTSYTRRTPRKMPPCVPSTKTLPSEIAKIIVISPATKYFTEVGNRRECCDVEDQVEKNITMIKYRGCLENEILGVH